MSLNPVNQSVANAQERSDASMESSTSNATIHPPGNPGSCASTNPQSSVGNAEEYCSIAQSWPNRKTTLGKRLHYLCNNEILSDVTFLVGEGAQQQRIPAHKLILSAGSAVFHAMFNGALATTSLEIEVPDVEPTAFLAVLLFLYTDEFHGDPETVLMTLYAAKKYAVPQVEEYCVEFLKSNLSSSNAFMLLTQARFFNEPDLASVCLEEIDKSTAVAVNTDGFRDIDIDTLTLVLERQTLRIEEHKLFEAVVSWSEAECTRQQLPVIPENQRTVLGKVLYLVRFPVMSSEQFAAGPAQSGILTQKEIVSQYQYFSLDPKPAVDFEVTPRNSMLGKELRARRFQSTQPSQYPWSVNCMIDRMGFSVDKRIFLTGFGVYGCKAAAFEDADGPDVHIDLIHASSGKVIASSCKDCSSNGSAKIYPVPFKDPVEIIANTEYTATAKFQGSVSHYGFQNLKRVTVDCASTKEKVTFEFSTPVNIATSFDTGYIPEIIFYI